MISRLKNLNSERDFSGSVSFLPDRSGDVVNSADRWANSLKPAFDTIKALASSHLCRPCTDFGNALGSVERPATRTTLTVLSNPINSNSRLW